MLIQVIHEVLATIPRPHKTKDNARTRHSVPNPPIAYTVGFSGLACMPVSSHAELHTILADLLAQYPRRIKSYLLGLYREYSNPKRFKVTYSTPP